MCNRSCLLILLAAALAASPARAQEVGDPRQGLSLARQVCSECHAIQAQQLKSPNPRAPAFPELATRPGVTANALAVMLTTPHAGMPMFRLSTEQRADITAYILGLRQGGPQPGR
jgi:mono/diheme cytochrome c family protein